MKELLDMVVQWWRHGGVYVGVILSMVAVLALLVYLVVRERRKLDGRGKGVAP